jgi:hypothetical protein
MISKLEKGIVLGLAFVGAVSTVNASNFEVVDSVVDFSNKKVGDVFTVDFENSGVINEMCEHLRSNESLIFARREVAEKIMEVVSENNSRLGLKVAKNAAKVDIFYEKVNEYGVLVSAIEIIYSPGIFFGPFENNGLPNNCDAVSFKWSELGCLPQLGFKSAEFEVALTKHLNIDEINNDDGKNIVGINDEETDLEREYTGIKRFVKIDVDKMISEMIKEEMVFEMKKIN